MINHIRGSLLNMMNGRYVLCIYLESMMLKLAFADICQGLIIVCNAHGLAIHGVGKS